MFTQNEIGLRKSMWLELLKDYDMSILYHPGKPNIGANSLSRLYMDSISHLGEDKKELEKICQ